MTGQGSTPAGWYPSPNEPGAERYYDGSQWSEHRRPLQTPPAPVPPAEPESAKPWYFRWWAITLWVFIGVVVIAGIAGDDTEADPDVVEQAVTTTVPASAETEEPEPEVTPPTTATPPEPEPVEEATTTTELPPDPVELLAAAVADDFERVDSVTFNEATGVVEFEGLFPSIVLSPGIEIRDELSDIVQDASKSDLEFDSVNVRVLLVLVDQLGNESESLVIDATWDAETVRAINWDNFNQENILAVGEVSFLHPTLRDDLG